MKLPARVWKSTLDGLFAFHDAADLGRNPAPTAAHLEGVGPVVAAREEDQLAVAVPGARMVVYPATGHSPNWERPDKVAADLDAFMREG